MDRSAHITIIGALSLALAACHVTRHNDVTLSGATKYQLHKGQRMVLAPRLEITRAGRFRLVEPIMCRRDILVEQVTHRDAIKKPNYATVVVGLLSGAAGVVALISALGDSSGVLVGGGLVGVGIGLPLTIGPFTGNTRKRRFVGVELSKRGRDFKRCAARALKVTRATLRHDKQRVHAVVDTNGELDVRVFDVFDAFAVHRLPAV